nr:hypothetical protein [Tanacetum cinerariifolium]
TQTQPTTRVFCIKTNHVGRCVLISPYNEARFEDERTTTTIANPSDLNIVVSDQVLEESTLHTSDKVEAFQTSMVATFEENAQQENLNEISKEKDDAKPPISIDTFGSGNDSRTSGSKTPAKKVVDNGIKSEEMDNESEDMKVERDTKKEGEPTILATFGSGRGITIWDPEIKSAFQDDTLRAMWKGSRILLSLFRKRSCFIIGVIFVIDGVFNIGESNVKSIEVRSKFGEFSENKASLEEVVVGGGKVLGFGEDDDVCTAATNGGDDTVESEDMSILNSLIGHGSLRSLQLCETIDQHNKL